MSQRVDAGRCAKVAERLEAWIDGEVDESEAAAITAHIEDCASCQREWRLAEEVVAELRSMPTFDPPEGVIRAVHQKTRPHVMEKLQSIFQGAVSRPLPVMATVAAVLLVVVVMTPWNRSSAPEYSDQEISRAADEVRLAFAYLGDMTRRAELRVKEKVLEERVAAQTLRGVRRSFQIIGGVGTTAAGPAAKPQPTVKGS